MIGWMRGHRLHVFPETKTFAQNPGFNEDIVEYFGNNDLILIAEGYLQNLFYKDDGI